MLVKESEYLKTIIIKLNKNRNLRILNIGSQNEEYQEKQSHIKHNIIKSINELNATLYNFDIFPGSAVDISGDIFNEKIYNDLKKINTNVMFVFNVLEHVVNVVNFVDKLKSLQKSGDEIFLSVPNSYPLHYDPIDNYFRPTIEQLFKLFNGYELIESKIVTDYTFKYYLFSSVKVFAFEFIRLITPFYKFKKWKNVVIKKYKWINKPFKVTCIHIKKL